MYVLLECFVISSYIAIMSVHILLHFLFQKDRKNTTETTKVLRGDFNFMQILQFVYN